MLSQGSKHSITDIQPKPGYIKVISGLQFEIFLFIHCVAMASSINRQINS